MWAALLTRAALACAAAPPAGVRVDVLGEAALIVFDPATRTEHFLRSARFDTTADGPIDFGFLVPTPSVPTLHEAPADLFERLTEATAPEVLVDVHRHLELTWTGGWLLGSTQDAAPRLKGAVEVLALQRVGAWDAAVLRADDPAVLRAWLADHGYPADAPLEAWLAGYTGTTGVGEPGWAITAFKLAKDAAGTDVALTPVRLTFTTDRPFYPYREPARPPDAPTRDRQLSLWLVAPGAWTGLVGGAPWAAERTFAAPVSDAALLQGVADLPTGAWLSAWTDRQRPRPGGAELTFEAFEPVEVRPPPTIEVREEPVPVPLDLVAGITLGAVALARRLRR